MKHETFILDLVYKEGYHAFFDSVYCMDCPYEGVSASLEEAWENGWWDGFYEGIDG